MVLSLVRSMTEIWVMMEIKMHETIKVNPIQIPSQELTALFADFKNLIPFFQDQL